MHVERRTNLMHVKRHANLMYRELHLFMHVKRRRCRRVGVVKRRSNAVMHLDNQGAESLSHEILRRRVGGVGRGNRLLTRLHYCASFLHACITRLHYYCASLHACITTQASGKSGGTRTRESTSSTCSSTGVFSLVAAKAGGLRYLEKGLGFDAQAQA